MKLQFNKKKVVLYGISRYLPWKIEDDVLNMFYSIGYDEYEGKDSD